MTIRNFPEHFWSGVDKTQDCWIWTRGRTSDDYGVLHIRPHHNVVGVGFGSQLAHRVAFALANGGITEGKWVLHRCDNPPCCNPDHLWEGNALENTLDMISKGRAPNFKGTKNPRSKLTVDDVNEIRKSQKTAQVLAGKYGVSHVAIGNIRRGKTYREIPVDKDIADQIRKRNRFPPIAVGDRFGRLICVEPLGKINGRTHFLFQCDCGSAPRQLRPTAVQQTIHTTRSCGCLRREAL